MDAAVLPESWSVATLNDIAEPFGGSTPSKSDASFWTDGTVPWVSPKDMKVFDLRGSEDLVSEKALARLSLIPEGSILVVVRSGILSRILPVAINHLPVTINQDMRAFVPAPEISTRFIAWQLLANQREILGKCSKDGTTVASIEAVALASFPFALPPAAEQHRIVAKIEELFSELDQGVASLKTAREQLKVYRQSLLKNAFEGKLTAAWRAAHADRLETAAALQQRIARERQARYQQQFADWQTAGQSGPRPKPPKPLPPLTAEELAELPELPAGWGWFKLVGVSDVSGGLTKNQKREQLSATRPYLRVANVYANRLELDEVHSIGVTDSELERVALEKGDLLIVEGNGSIDQIGRVALWLGQISGCVHQNHIIKARPLKLATSKFLLYFLMSELGRKFIVRAASSTSGLHTLSISKVEGLFVPLCSGNEQAEVIAELESKLSEAEQLDQTLATALQQADALRQSILKKAFCGQLVKQDENDEPATALLERIRAAKSASGKGKPRRTASEQPEILELTASPGQVIPFPLPLPGIAAKDLQAGIVAMAYRLHAPDPKKLEHFGHVKAEKICHLVEAHLGLDLERQPVKEAAGPNDYPHLKRVEHRARLANWFEVTRQDSGKYVFHPKPGFSRLLDKTRRVLGARLGEVERLLELMLPMTMRQAEILATVYAAWNNLLLLGKSPNDEEIVTEARENWHESKLKIERDKFFTALAWMRGKGLVPSGRGRFVAAKGKK